MLWVQQSFLKIGSASECDQRHLFSEPPRNTLTRFYPWNQAFFGAFWGHSAVDHLSEFQVEPRLEKRQMVVHYTDSSGKSRVQGGRDLKSPQEYPKEFLGVSSLFSTTKWFLSNGLWPLGSKYVWKNVPKYIFKQYHILDIRMLLVFGEPSKHGAREFQIPVTVQGNPNLGWKHMSSGGFNSASFLYFKWSPLLHYFEWSPSTLLISFEWSPVGGCQTRCMVRINRICQIPNVPTHGVSCINFLVWTSGGAFGSPKPTGNLQVSCLHRPQAQVRSCSLKVPN